MYVMLPAQRIKTMKIKSILVRQQNGGYFTSLANKENSLAVPVHT